MQKTAQKRGIIDRLKEYTNIDGIAAEKFFDPQLKAIMEVLREKDEELREIAGGEHKSLEEKIGIKGLVKLAQSNFNKRRYMAAIAYLELFNGSYVLIKDLLNEIKAQCHDKIHNDLLFKGLSDSETKMLRRLKQRHASRKGMIVKEAGKFSDFGDWLYSVTNKEGRALAFWEKRYPDQANKIKKGVEKVLSSSKELLDLTLDNLQLMADARGERNLNEYVRLSNEIVGKFQEFNTIFTEAYNKDLKDFIGKMSEKVEEPKEVGSTWEIKPPMAEVPSLDLPKPKSTSELASKYAPLLSTPSVEAPTRDISTREVSTNRVPQKFDSTQEVSLKDMSPVTSIKPSDYNPFNTRQNTLMTGKQDAFQAYEFGHDGNKLVNIPKSSTQEVSLRDMTPAGIQDTPYKIDRDRKDQELAAKQRGFVSVPHPGNKDRVVVKPPTVRGVVPSRADTEVDTEVDTNRVAPSFKDLADETQRNPATKPGVQSVHASFISAIEKMGNSDPKVLSMYIKKYAKAIEEEDLETSIKLLKVAASIG